MRKEIFASLAVVGVVATVAVFAVSQYQPEMMQLNSMDTQFVDYLAKYGKSYLTKEEYAYRKELFEQSMGKISESNSKNDVTYRLAINKFADLSEYELSRYMGELPLYTDTIKVKDTPSAVSAPVDWSSKLNAVKDQGSCGSCWSFSTIAGTEGRYSVKYGKKVVLSEQQLVDCSSAYGNAGCNGGLAKSGYQYGT